MAAQRYLLLVLLLAAAHADPACAQNNDGGSRFDLSGFLKVDAFYDTRQTVAAREGEFLLYPSPVEEQLQDDEDAGNEDAHSERIDVNDRSNFNMTSFYSRLRLEIAAPEVLGGETAGIVEGDFLGTTDGLENTLRLRHAFVDIDWGTHEVILGQYWSPLFVPQVFPRTVSFNLGVPIQPLARFPQVRLTARPSEQVSLIGALSVQRDAYQDIAGRKTQQQAGVPGAHLHAQFSSDVLFAGAGTYLRTVRPELASERVTSGALSAYARLETARWAVRAQALYGTNMADHLMLGGYARAALSDQQVTYRNLRTLATWADFSVAWENFSIGLFGGYTANLGASGDVPPSASVAFQARGSDLAHVWRVSPRIKYDIGTVRFALELESTTALYASERGSDLQPEAESGDPVTNLRALFSTFLFF